MRTEYSSDLMYHPAFRSCYITIVMFPASIHSILFGGKKVWQNIQHILYVKFSHPQILLVSSKRRSAPRSTGALPSALWYDRCRKKWDLRRSAVPEGGAGVSRAGGDGTVDGLRNDEDRMKGQCKAFFRWKERFDESENTV